MEAMQTRELCSVGIGLARRKPSRKGSVTMYILCPPRIYGDKQRIEMNRNVLCVGVIDLYIKGYGAGILEESVIRKWACESSQPAKSVTAQ